MGPSFPVANVNIRGGGMGEENGVEDDDMTLNCACLACLARFAHSSIVVAFGHVWLIGGISNV